MRWIPLTTLILLAAAAPAVCAELIPPYTARYEAQVLGSSLVAVSTLRHEDGSVRMAMDAHVSGFLRLLGRFEFKRGSVLRPEEPMPRVLETHSHHVTPRRERRADVEFDWTTNRARGEVDGVPFEKDVPPGTQDFLSSMYLTMTLLRSGAFKDSFSVTLMERNRLREYTMERRDTERVATRMGPMDAIRIVRRNGSGVEVAGWFAPQMGFAPVRLQYEADGSVLDLELVEFEWQEPPAAPGN